MNNKRTLFKAPIHLLLGVLCLPLSCRTKEPLSPAQISLVQKVKADKEKPQNTAGKTITWLNLQTLQDNAPKEAHSQSEIAGAILLPQEHTIPDGHYPAPRKIILQSRYSKLGTIQTQRTERGDSAVEVIGEDDANGLKRAIVHIPEHSIVSIRRYWELGSCWCCNEKPIISHVEIRVFPNEHPITRATKETIFHFSKEGDVLDIQLEGEKRFQQPTIVHDQAAFNPREADHLDLLTHRDGVPFKLPTSPKLQD